jgi:hypothetical protein
MEKIEINYPIQKALEHLSDFSADVIASLTLVKNYDLKQIAYDLDLVLTELNHKLKEED